MSKPRKIAVRKQHNVKSKADQTDQSVDALISLIGLRVRSARKEKGLSRRALSELSGVSQRYLAQLEGGDGNTSISLLKRVAIALDLSIQSIVAENDPISKEAAVVAEQFRKADASTRAQVQRVLDPGKSRELKAERICLIGLRGAGKSTLGAQVASKFDLPFVELNSAIESRVGIPVSEIIALYGQEGYRELESECLSNIIETEKRLVLAVAGGVVADTATFNQLLSAFHTIWLKASPSEHMERVWAQGDMRPMADNPQAMRQLRQILKSREDHYSRASFCLDTTGKTPEVSLAELCETIVNEGLLQPASLSPPPIN